MVRGELQETVDELRNARGETEHRRNIPRLFVDNLSVAIGMFNMGVRYVDVAARAVHCQTFKSP